MLWYASDRPGSRGRRDLWVSRRDSLEGPWFDPINLGNEVNSDGFEQTPCATEDGLTHVVVGFGDSQSAIENRDITSMGTP